MASSERGFTAIVLAAQRGGRLDPLADRAGVSHKCLVPIAGKPLLEHVLRALTVVPGLSRIHISIEKEAVPAIRAVPGACGGLGIPVDYVPAATNLADSVYAAAHGVDEPMLITTADNVLLTPEAIEKVVARMRDGAEVVVAMATREAVLAAHPDGQRRFYRFTDAQYSNCNLYGLSGDKAVRLAEAFRSGGQFAKNPKRVAEAFGLVNLLILRFGLVSLEGAMRRLSRRFGVRAEAVVLGDGAHAIDVDNGRTYEVARLLLLRRAGQAH
ncbi:MAG: NTP transferase domain-containing protein [Pseudomonadota bacterium]|nr:NTP transferase domain-containing protein [Pseudomonadota bacterium]